MRTNFRPQRALGLISSQGEILKNIKGRALLKLTTLINASFRLNFTPDTWKTAEVIMMPKPGKNLSEVESCRPISLLPIMSKLLEKMILKHLKHIIAEEHLVPTHQIVFNKSLNRPGAFYDRHL
jgi:hypothetical protein